MPLSTAVLSVGYDLPDLLEDAPPLSVFPDELSRDDLGGATEAIDAGLHHSGHALVIYPTWLGEATPRRLQTIRAALGSTRLALYGSALPPLAGGVLSNLACALATHLRPGQLVAALPDLQRELVVVSWLGSLTGLKEPAPSVLLHLASWSPRSTFGVVLQPEPAIVRADKAGQKLPLQRASRPMELVVAPQPGVDALWIEQSARDALGDMHAETVDPTAHGASWWGTSRLVEVVAFPTQVAELAAELTRRQRLRLCGWCSEAIASTPCPFCRGADEPYDVEIGADREAGRLA
jgi:hypothetical protein